MCLRAWIEQFVLPFARETFVNISIDGYERDRFFRGKGAFQIHIRANIVNDIGTLLTNTITL